MQPTRLNKPKSNLKPIIITSIVWIVLIGAVIGVMKYGEAQRTQGMLEGFMKAKEIILSR